MKPKQKIFLISAVFGLMALSLIVFLIYPLFKEIKKNSEQLILAKKELILLQAKVKNLEQFEETYRALEPNLAKVDEFFIDPEVPIDFIEFLEKTGLNSGVTIDISPTSIRAIQNDPWPSMGFQISLAGSSQNFLKFLEKIETSPYLIAVQNLTASRSATKELTDRVNGTLSIKVFTKQ